ncbi:Uu.00g068050.m01.CDS01 [Anthostomella pinea]|uniref:Uu.00g068050.m01.CDS01 n=1 Tax=Anthostomella pinea TaxID=933095 RepID=A0AAI8YNH1_9PEZI|nr:Uu.00g068050.m01.CDS01 [Anthostomella pinea]
MTPSADTIQAANPDILISCARRSGTRPEYFDLGSEHAWAGTCKIVWELHLYGSSDWRGHGHGDLRGYRYEAALYRHG